MARNNELMYPCVKIKSPYDRPTSDLKQLAKKIAQRNYSTEENPAIKRLQERFEKI